MRWFTRVLLQAAGIIVTGTTLFLVFTIWTSVSLAHAQEATLGTATPSSVTVQATPTEDATMTALNKEKLTQEVLQLKGQNEPSPLDWFRTNASIFLSTLVVVVGSLFGFWRWRVDRLDAQDKELKDRQNSQGKELKDRQNEREKRAEERFQSAVTGLGDKKEGARIGAAIVLRTFLREGEGYELFYAQIFDLAVAHLRLRPIDAENTEPLDSLSQALITLFKESFPQVRNQHIQDTAQQLDAARIQLDQAFLASADLKQAWMPFAYLREANLHQANLHQANLHQANLYKANLYKANLRKATLYRANLSTASLRGANLSGTELGGANLRGTDLAGADLTGATLGGVNLLNASSLKHTNLCGIKGLTKEQLEACKAKGAIIDEYPTTSASQSTSAPSSPLQSNYAQASTTPYAQESTPSPDPAGSTTASAQADPES